MKQVAYDPEAKVRLVCNSPIARKAMLSIGDLAIPFYKASVVFEPDGFVTITAIVPAGEVDIEALQSQTRLLFDEGQVKPLQSK